MWLWRIFHGIISSSFGHRISVGISISRNQTTTLNETTACMLGYDMGQEKYAWRLHITGNRQQNNPAMSRVMLGAYQWAARNRRAEGMKASTSNRHNHRRWVRLERHHLPLFWENTLYLYIPLCFLGMELKIHVMEKWPRNMLLVKLTSLILVIQDWLPCHTVLPNSLTVQKDSNVLH